MLNHTRVDEDLIGEGLTVLSPTLEVAHKLGVILTTRHVFSRTQMLWGRAEEAITQLDVRGVVVLPLVVEIADSRATSDGDLHTESKQNGLRVFEIDMRSGL